MNSNIKYTFLFLLTFFSFGILLAQTPLSEATREAEVLPQWPDCPPEVNNCTKSRLLDFIAANVTQPVEAKTHGMGGVVLVEFVVEKNGMVGEVHAMNDPGHGLGTEAVRVISLMNQKKIKWSPAVKDGKRIAFRYVIPVSFNVDSLVQKPDASQVTELDMPEIYDVAEVMPRFAGCEIGEKDTVDCTFVQLLNHIKTNLVYPDTALSVGVQGPVVVEFIIDPSGNVTNAVVKKGIGYGCDEEAVRVLSLMPMWKPGMQGGKPVAVRMMVPVMFQISKPDKQ